MHFEREPHSLFCGDPHSIYIRPSSRIVVRYVQMCHLRLDIDIPQTCYVKELHCIFFFFNNHPFIVEKKVHIYKKNHNKGEEGSPPLNERVFILHENGCRVTVSHKS